MFGGGGIAFFLSCDHKKCMWKKVERSAVGHFQWLILRWSKDFSRNIISPHFPPYGILYIVCIYLLQLFDEEIIWTPHLWRNRAKFHNDLFVFCCDSRGNRRRAIPEHSATWRCQSDGPRQLCAGEPALSGLVSRLSPPAAQSAEETVEMLGKISKCCRVLPFLLWDLSQPDPLVKCSQPYKKYKGQLKKEKGE